MSKLTNPEFAGILSEYAAEANTSGERLSGEKFFKELDAQVYQGAKFDELPEEERRLYDLIAETAEEVLAEEKAKARAV